MILKVVDRNNTDYKKKKKKKTLMNTPPNFIVFVPKSMRERERATEIKKKNCSKSMTMSQIVAPKP